MSQIFSPDFPYSRKYNLLRLAPYQFVTSHEALVGKNFSLTKERDVSVRKVQRILLWTAILIQTKVSGGIMRVI